MIRAAIGVVIVLLCASFDHVKHAAQTKDAIACTSCHATTKTGLGAKPSHATCFGKCHGPAPSLPTKGKKLVVEPARMAVCTTCHTQGSLEAGTDKKSFAPNVRDPSADFALAIGHKRHANVTCAQCHAQTKPAPHTRCASCHVGGAGKGPTMSLCTGCHFPADKTPQLVEAKILVRSAFSHAKHATRGAAAKCATCHAGVTDTDARELEHPTAKTCAIAGCHDGKAAFPPTEACTKCHQDVPVGKFDVARPPGQFSHAFHLAYVSFVACTTCHPVAKSGEVGLADHAQCASCHEEDFGARSPKICSACHDATEPWRKLNPDRPSLPKSEFGASLDHDKHRAACTNCHNLTTASAQLRPPRGHTSCAGKGCHAVSGGAPPTFVNCGACHDLGIEERRETQREAATWSVRKLFTHAKHERAPDGNALACTTCHLDVGGSDLLSIATPPKSTCVPCHDGQTSFKITGTGCSKCHLKPKQQ
jgi:c(7)-type cytochrome triheme protein